MQNKNGVREGCNIQCCVVWSQDVCPTARLRASVTCLHLSARWRCARGLKLSSKNRKEGIVSAGSFLLGQILAFYGHSASRSHGSSTCGGLAGTNVGRRRRSINNIALSRSIDVSAKMRRRKQEEGAFSQMRYRGGTLTIYTVSVRKRSRSIVIRINVNLLLF